MLRHPRWDWHILALSRADDPDRAPRFRRAGAEYGAEVGMSDLDDSPALAPLSPGLHEIKERVLRSISDFGFRISDLIFTHGSAGEYTRHQRHEQVHQAVVEMWESGELCGTPLFFAYEDAGGTHKPAPAPDAQILIALTSEEYARKQHIVRAIYGFQCDSFEAESAGPVEAFTTPADPETITRLKSALLDIDR